MKFDFLELENISRVLFCAFFIALAILGIVGLIKGNYLHIITVSGFSTMAYCALKVW